MHEEWRPMRSTAEAEMLRGHCQKFSRMGWALFVQMLSMLAVQALVILVVQFAAPQMIQNGIFFWCLSVVSAYGVGVPMFYLVIRGLEAPVVQQPSRGPLGPARFFQVYVIALAALYLTNMATLAALWLVGVIRGVPLPNPVEGVSDYPVILNALLGCIIAPVLEEWVFRGLLLRRLRPYGEKFAMIASAMAFGLFHGNFNQMFYAFSLGLIFAYVVMRTGRLWQVMLLHAMVNAISMVVLPLLGDAGLMVAGYLILAAIIGGIIFCVVRRRECFYLPGDYAFGPGRTWRLFFENPGVILFCILALLISLSYFIVM